MSLYPSPTEMEEVTLLDLADTALDKGIVVWGDATVSVADVDLVFLGVKLVLASVETMESWREGADGRPEAGGNGEDGRAGRILRGPAASPPERQCETLPPAPGEQGRPGKTRVHRESRKRLPLDCDKAEQGLAKLVLTVVELLRQLLERQAIRRMNSNSLSPDEIERMGLTFQRLEEKMEEVKRVFGLSGEELNLNLGPLGNLM